MDPHATPLRTRHLVAGIGTRVVLAGVTIDFVHGGTTVVVGPGGSGKSTLLRLLATPDDSPDEFWWGGEVDVPSGRTAWLGQRTEALGATLRETLRACGHAEAEATLSRTWRDAPRVEGELRDALDVDPGQLAPRTRRLLDLTARLAEPASVALLDEPEAGLDAATLDAVAAGWSAATSGRTTVVVTHNVRFAEAVADHVVFLLDGVVIEQQERVRFFQSPIHERSRSFLRWGA